MLSRGVSISPAYAPSLFSKDRPLEVSRLISDQGLTLERVSRLKYESWVKLIGHFGRPTFYQRRFLDYRDRPFDIPPEQDLLEASFLTGYFQSFDFIEKNLELVVPILINHINKVVVPDVSIEDVNIIHVRGGDLNNPENFRKYGILGTNYYLSIPLNYSLPTIIVTDDLERARFIASKIRVNSILGPNQLDPWQTLKLMVNSKNLYAANSTLSLWASFLRSQKNKPSFVPNPIFRDPNFDTNRRLNISGVKKIPSQFQYYQERYN